MESLHIHPESSQEYPPIFNQNKIQDIEWFLEERPALKKEDIVKLATAVSIFDQILFDTYHNLFQFQYEKSAGYIKRLKEGYEKDMEKIEIGSREHEVLQKRITVAEAFISFTEEFGWNNAHAAARLLEDVLV